LACDAGARAGRGAWRTALTTQPPTHHRSAILSLPFLFAKQDENPNLSHLESQEARPMGALKSTKGRYQNFEYFFNIKSELK
jgi:hypothetical protein